MGTDNQGGVLVSISTPEELKPKFPYLQKLIVLSKLINMWPRDEKTNPFFYHLGVWIVIVNCITIIFSFVIQIKKEYKNMDSITELIDFVTVFISGTFRYVYIYIRGDNYLRLVFLIHNNFIHYSIFPTENRTSLDKYYRLAKGLILSYTSFTFFWILQICMMPIITYFWTMTSLNETEAEQVPYPIAMKVYAPFDYYYKQPENILFYVYQVIGFIIFGFIYVLVDSFWYMVILLTIGQFALIKDSINTLTEILRKNEKEENIRLLNESQTKNVEDSFKKCIKHHQFIRKFLRMLDDINNPNILVDSLHAVISIGFILLDVTISLNTRDWNKVMYSFEYFITSIAHMFLFDWLGNELIMKEEELAKAIYEIPWYRFQSQKSVLLLMTIQSRRPNRLTGGKMYKLSLEFFTSMIKAVFSYFTFLLQMRNVKSK